MSKPEIVYSHIKVKPTGYYVYVHRRISDGCVFYVGKGCRRRAFVTDKRGIIWKRIAAKHGVFVEIVKDGMPEHCAYILEEILIRKYSDMGVFLANRTLGGDGWKGGSHNEAARLSMSAKRTGELNPNYGKKHSDRARKAISEKVSGTLHGKYDWTVYSFQHDIIGTESLTQNQFRLKYGLSHSGVSSLCSGRYLTHKGWRLA